MSFVDVNKLRPRVGMPPQVRVGPRPDLGGIRPENLPGGVDRFRYRPRPPGFKPDQGGVNLEKIRPLLKARRLPTGRIQVLPPSPPRGPRVRTPPWY